MKNSFEQTKLEEPYIEKALEKALGVFEDAIDPNDFYDVYEDYEIEKNLTYTAGREEQFEREKEKQPQEMRRAHEISKILEAILYEHGELSDWFGPSAVTTLTSRYDDIANGVDEIIGFEGGVAEDFSYIGLAVDITTGQDVAKKFRTIRKELESGSMAKVKYFTDPDGNHVKGGLEIPRVIVGIDRKTTINLIEAWMSNDTTALASHEAHIKILLEIKYQLETFTQIAADSGFTELAQTLKNDHDTIFNVLKEKGFKNPGSIERKVLETKELLHQCQMARTTNWKPFCNALNYAQCYCL